MKVQRSTQHEQSHCCGSLMLAKEKSSWKYSAWKWLGWLEYPGKSQEQLNRSCTRAKPEQNRSLSLMKLRHQATALFSLSVTFSWVKLTPKIISFPSLWHALTCIRTHASVPFVILLQTVVCLISRSAAFPTNPTVHCLNQKEQSEFHISPRI